MCNRNVRGCSTIGTVRRSCTTNIASRFVLPAIMGGSNAVGTGSDIISFGFEPSHTQRFAHAFISPSFSKFRHGGNFFPLGCIYVARCSRAVPGIDMTFPPRRLAVAFNRCLTAGGVARLEVTRARGCTRMAFFFGNNRRGAFSNRSEVLVGSPSIPAFSLRPRVDTCPMYSTIYRRVEDNGCSTIVLGFTGYSVINRANVFSTTIGTMRTISRYINGMISTAARVNNTMVVATSRKGTSCVFSSGNRPFAPRAAGPIPFYIMKCPYRLGRNNELTSVIPSVLGVLKLPRPGRVANRSVVGWCWGHSCRQFFCIRGFAGFTVFAFGVFYVLSRGGVTDTGGVCEERFGGNWAYDA